VYQRKIHFFFLALHILGKNGFNSETLRFLYPLLSQAFLSKGHLYAMEENIIGLSHKAVCGTFV